MSPCQFRSGTNRSVPIRLACNRRAAKLVTRQSDFGQRAAVGFTGEPLMRTTVSFPAKPL